MKQPGSLYRPVASVAGKITGEPGCPVRQHATPASREEGKYPELLSRDYPLTDTHCHFDFLPFQGTEVASLMAAAQANVTRLIVPAVTSAFFPRVMALAASHKEIFVALGLHPLYMKQHSDTGLTQLASWLQQKPDKLVAVGETGLDFYAKNSAIEHQRMLLQAQLALAKQHDLPVILHSRRSHDQLAAILRTASLSRTGVVHAFSGSLVQAEAFVRLGYYIGVGGLISYLRAHKTRQVMARLPLTSLVLETDAPDMPLSGRQGMPNRPEYLAEVFRILCQLRPEPAGQIARQLHENSCTLFNLPQ